MLHLCVHGFRAFNPSGFTPERRRLVRAQVLRAARPDPLAARSQRTSALPSRGAAPHRLYCFAQRIGLSLEEIGAELAKLPEDRTPTRADWSRISGTWTKRIDQKISELQRLRAGLTQCIGCGCLSIDKCEYANPADRAGTRGPGPRFWLT